jgi:hypothetical protein
MECNAWKKDETPYLVFSCSKCHQFTYVRPTRKSKKCARCGRSHVVSKILERGDIVYGLSTAVELVKRKQNEFAIKELGTHPDFRTFNDFTITKPLDKKEKNIDEENIENEYYSRFKEMLFDISKKYKRFPLYIIEIMADNYYIPESEVKLLTRSFQKQGILKLVKDYLYQVKLD